MINRESDRYHRPRFEGVRFNYWLVSEHITREELTVLCGPHTTVSHKRI